MGCLWAGYDLDKVYHIMYGNVLEKNDLDYVVCGIYLVYKIQIFHQLMEGVGFGICAENKHSIFWVYNAERG